MKTYASRSSNQVRIITLTAIAIAFLICFSVIFKIDQTSNQMSFIICFVVIGTVLYFYTHALNKVFIDADKLVLKKNFGQTEIDIQDIINIQHLNSSHLSMTFGSKGVFGFIGHTMDNCKSYVKDRKNMIRIDTSEKKYVFSVNSASQLIHEIINHPDYIDHSF